MIVVLMGVSGAGKSTVGRALADELGFEYHEGDELHTPASRDKSRIVNDKADSAALTMNSTP